MIPLALLAAAGAVALMFAAHRPKAGPFVNVRASSGRAYRVQRTTEQPGNVYRVQRGELDVLFYRQRPGKQTREFVRSPMPSTSRFYLEATKDFGL